jgi:undecaprenyl-diphosphatase
VLLWTNGWPDALEPLMWAIQQFGLLFAPLAVGAVVAIAGRRWTLIIPFVLVLPLKLLLEKAVVKTLVERERPYVSYGTDIVVREHADVREPSGETSPS